MKPGDAVLRFLESVGRGSEAAYYVRLFRASRPERFALIVVDDDVIESDRATLVLDLDYLLRLGLQPVVVLPSRTAAIAVRDELGDRAAPELFEDAAGALAAIRAGVLPVAGPCEVAELARELQTRKIVLLTSHRGLKPSGQRMASMIDLTVELDHLQSAGVLLPEQAALLLRARDLIDAVDHTMAVAVTSPLQLLRELFTVRGAGTLIRRGVPVHAHHGYATVDRARLAAVIESAFGASVPPDFFSRRISHVYIAGRYDGAAVVTPTDLGPYLCKFAVDRRAQGEGIGRDLWRTLCKEHPSLFWRSRQANAITGWYIQQCEGMSRQDGWSIFWRGLAPAEIPQAIDLACAAPDDFPNRGEDAP